MTRTAERLKALEDKVALLSNNREASVASASEPSYPIGEIVSVRGKIRQRNSYEYRPQYTDVVVVTGVLDGVTRHDNAKPSVTIGKSKSSAGVELVDVTFL